MPYDIIYNYKALNKQEEVERKVMLDFIKNNDNTLLRENKVAHFTTSAFILNESLTKVVFAYHLIYNSWSWIGGHNDGDNDFLNVALKEASEETGLKTLNTITNKPLMLDIIHVSNHYKNGEYIPDHLHFNLTYFLLGNECEKLTISENENSDVKWIDIDEMVNITSEDRMRSIYKKAYNIINNIKTKGIKYYDNFSE